MPAPCAIRDPAVIRGNIRSSALDPELVGEVLIATHEMGFARRVADRICFLDAGSIVEQRPPAQVLDAPTMPRTRQFRQRIHDSGRGRHSW